MLGSAFFQRSDELKAFGILLASSILLQTFGITRLDFRTRRIFQRLHGLVVTSRNLEAQK